MYFWQKYNQCDTVIIIGDTNNRRWIWKTLAFILSLYGGRADLWLGWTKQDSTETSPWTNVYIPGRQACFHGSPWLLACIVPKTSHMVFFGRLILIKARKLVRLTHPRSSVCCPPTHLGCGCLLHIWLPAKADTGLLGLWPRGTHICAAIPHNNDQGLHALCHSLQEHFPWTPTIAALLTWHLEIYADKTEDVTLVGVSVILSHDSWLYLGDMASARLFCKVRTSQGRLHRESTESMWRSLVPCLTFIHQI